MPEMMPEMPREIVEAVLDRLRQPFAKEDIKWKPQTINWKEKTAMAVPHADPRAYIDRLNEAVGVDGWTQHFTFIVTPFQKFTKGRKGYGDQEASEDKLVPGNRVLCICTLSIPHIGVHSSTGESDASDENAATSAEAQAFKRAAMNFGLGRYLYDLPKMELPYDTTKKVFKTQPSLPAWALPPVEPTQCDDCGGVVKEIEINKRTYSVDTLIDNSQSKYGKNLCQPCQVVRSVAAKAAGGNRVEATA